MISEEAEQYNQQLPGEFLLILKSKSPKLTFWNSAL